MANHRFKQKDTQRHSSAVMFICILLCILSILTPQAVCVTCGGDFTSSYGVVVSPNYPQTYPVNVGCIWHIHPNETQTTNRTEVGVTLDFRRFQTLDGTSSDVETLKVFTSDPSNATSTLAPYRQFRGKSPAILKRLNVTGSNELWLVFQSASQGPVTGEALGFRVLYLVNGADVQCDPNPLVHGRIKNDSDGSLSLQSTVRFECDWGYRMEGEVTGQCNLDGDGVDSVSPRWSNIPTCVSTCPTPASIANGTYVKNGSLNVNSTVTYSCDVPYLLDRQDPTVTCVLGGKGAPTWNSNPPGCSIPTCRSNVSISLTSPSGALVNPSFPGHSVLGGTNCQWQVRVQSGKAVNFNVTYFDLPPRAQLSFLDLVTKRVYQVFKGEDGTPTERSFNVSTSSVHVVYNGADTASSTHQGFYISYRAVEPSTPLVPPTTSTTARSSTATPIMTSSHYGPPSSEKVITDNDNSGSSDAGKIAGGVVAGIIAVLLVVACVGFHCYRKKFPVRMVGRSFGKFSNPEYRAPGRASTLVREDAGDYFEHQMQPESHSQVNIILGGDEDEENRVEYVNVAFQYDSHDSDEEEVERRFRERKSYLFKKDEDDQTDGKKREKERRQGGSSKSGERSKKAKKSKENGRIGRDGGHENAAYVDSDAESVSSSYSSDISDSASTKDKKSKESLNGKTSDGASLQSAGQQLPAEGETNTEDEDAEIPHYAPGIVKPRSASMSTEAMPAMTVKQFLARIAREKRANSDVGNPRPGSLTSFDITKSARRRAQSAGDIWDTVAVSAPELSKLPTASEESSRENQQPLGRESRLDSSVENLSELPDEVTAGGSRRVSSSSSEQSHDYINVNSVTGDVRRDIAPESSSPEVEKDATERDRSKSSSTSSSSEEEEAAPLPPRDQQVFFMPGLSTAADPNLEDRTASSQDDQSDEDSDHPEVVSLPKEDSDLDDTLPHQIQMVASHSNDTPENSSENEDKFPTPPPPLALQARPPPVGAEDASLSHSFVVLSSTDAGQSESKDAESISSEDTGSSVESAVTSSGAEFESYSVNVDVPEERQTEPDSDNHASNWHHNPEQKYSQEKPPPSEDFTDIGYEHSTPTKHQMPGEISVGEAKALPQAGVEQHPSEAPKKKAVTVEGLTSLTYSDGSSSSSSSSESDESDDEDDTRKKNDETRPLPTSAIPISPSEHKDAETGHKDVRTLPSDITFTSGSPGSNSSSSSEQHEPQPMQFTFTEGSHGPQSSPPEQSDRLQFLGAAAGDQPAPRTLQLGSSSPEQSPRPRGLAALRKHPEQSDRLQFLGAAGDQPAVQPADQPAPRTLQLGNSSPELSPRPRGLAALRGHPSTRQDSGSRHSDSDSDLEFTEEDIERVLVEGSDVSSDDGPPPLPVSPPPGAQKVAVKLQPSEMFVFDEEDNEDIEC